MNKNVLILGANSDIAKACALLFNQKGFSITLASRDIEALRTFNTQEKFNADITFFDALDFISHPSFYQSLTIRPDVVICAFGYLTENMNAFTHFEEAEKVMDTNFKGAVSILNLISQDMKERKEGCIIGMSSVAADRGRASNLIYSAAKAGFDAYLSGLRNMMNPYGVKVITIKPGFVATKMIAQHPTPSFLTSSPQALALKIYRTYQQNRNIVYSNIKWRTIMLVIQSIPERIFKKLKL